MLYKTKCLIIEATRLTTPVTLGGLTGAPGDWLVVGIDGQPQVLLEAEFLARYEPCDDAYARPTRFGPERKPRVRARKNGPMVEEEPRELL